MKNLKKVLALAVAFVMCFTMFAGAAVFSDVPVGGNYSEAITFLSDLQIIAGKPDGTFGVNDAITRADAACLIARMMTGQQNPPKYDNHVAFSDVPVGSYYEAAVGYCAALGVTSGTGGGKFSPMKTITDGEFVAMLTRALGYDTPENPLQFPMGNITVAQAKGLLDGVSIDYMSDALRGEDAQMLYNAVFADYDREAKNKNVYQSADDHYNVTIAEEVFDLARYSFDENWKSVDNADKWDFHGSYKQAAHKCTAHTWVIAGVDARDKTNTYVAFAIDDDDEKPIQTLRDNGALIDADREEGAYITFTYDGDIKPLIGYRVELWGEMDHPGKEPAIVAVKALDGQTVTNWNPGIFDGDANNKVKVDDKTLIMTRDSNTAYAAKINLDKNNWNTRSDKSAPYHDRAYTLAVASESDKVDEYNQAGTLRVMNIARADGDQYKLFDWDSDDKIDFVVRDTYKYGEVKTVSKSRVVIEAEDNQDYALKLGEKNLVVQGADGLAEGDVVEISVADRVYDSGEAKEAVTINIAQVEAESKTLEKINLTKDLYTFDGEELSLAQPHIFDLVDETDTLEDFRTKENVGSAFNLYFDRSGFIIKGKVADDSARGYLMVLNTVDGNSNLNKNNKRDLAALDVLFDDNTTQDEVPVVKDLQIRVNGNSKWSSELNGYNKNGRVWNQLKVVGNVYKYYMNKDGEITRLDEQTLTNATDYSFDDSKDRFSIYDNASNNKDVYRSFETDEKAVVFAVRSTNATDKDGKIKGYIRVDKTAHKHEYTDGPNDSHFDSRYYVDADDVVAVPVEDIPEIDNRRSPAGEKKGSGWERNASPDNLWRESDVTHPSVFLQGEDSLKFARLTEDKDGNFVPTFTEHTPSWMDFGKTDAGADSLMKSMQMWADDSVGTDDNSRVVPVKNANGLAQVGTFGDASKTAYVPAISYNTNKDGAVNVAVIGVDTLDYFNSSSVKLALITDVNYHGSKAYSIEAAIDGKVENFKTVTGDEEDIFVGRKDGTLDSVNDIDSYLNQNRNDYDNDAYKGARHGLYAEVSMNSDGLITKVRAMDIVKPTDKEYTLDGKNPAKTVVAEGNVYRVVRGVITELRTSGKNTWVDWQTNPIAWNSGSFYQLTKAEDHNLYDTLEAKYDTDTYFYEVTKHFETKQDAALTVDAPFHKDVSSKLKAADMNILEESVFVNTKEDAVYFVADFAVRKSQTDELVAVVMCTEDYTNGNVTDAVTNLEGKHLTFKDNKFVNGGNIPAEQNEYYIDVNEIPSSTETIDLKIARNGGDYIDVSVPGKTSKTDAADAIVTALEALSDPDFNFKAKRDGNRVTVTVKTAAAGEKPDTYDFNFKSAESVGYKFAVGISKAGKDEIKNSKVVNASSTITVAANAYKLEDLAAIKIVAENGKLAGVTSFVVKIERGTYSANSLAAAIAKAIDDEIKKQGLSDIKAEADGRVVTITDTSIDKDSTDTNGDPVETIGIEGNVTVS